VIKTIITGYSICKGDTAFDLLVGLAMQGGTQEVENSTFEISSVEMICGREK